MCPVGLNLSAPTDTRVCVLSASNCEKMLAARLWKDGSEESSSRDRKAAKSTPRVMLNIYFSRRIGVLFFLYGAQS